MPNIPRAAGKGIILLKPETWETLRQVLTDLEIILDPKDFEVTTRAGKKLIRLRPGKSDEQTPGSGGGELCAFGVILTLPDDAKAIAGGMVYCGDKNFLVPPYDIDLETDTEEKLYLELDCESNRDDDNEIFLPGIYTSSETTPSSFWQTTAGSYPDNTSPVLATGIGTIIIPLGTLTVADGIASFDPTGCGNVTVGQCGGTLSHTRA